MPDRERYNGGCLCGGVRFFVAGPPISDIEACHCSQCARWTGNFLTAATVEQADMTFVSQDTLKWFKSSKTGRRGFCAACGSSLFWKREGDAKIDILAGSFDQSTGFRISHHIFVADKPDFYDISDDAPQYPGPRTGAESRTGE
ncbi:MAG: GFA family protein [Fimbriimonadaceae bacterium]|nr:GFA family protein [Alphaproteobacteria bacterium]